MTFRFDVQATTTAAEEQNVDWGLDVSLKSVGMKWISSGGAQFPTTEIKVDQRVIASSNSPSGGQGTKWQPVFTQAYQKSAILVPDYDSYQFTVQLVPLQSIFPSPPLTAVLREDID